MAKKIVALLSGGLDSQLAIKIMQKQGFDVSAIAIKTPFCDFDCGRGCGSEIRETADKLNVNLKTVYLGDKYIDMLKNPKHKFGSGMNPCIDCRSMMFKEAKKYMKKIKAEFIISGEVLGQRPMSQHHKALKIIEQESGLKDKIVRPLSGALLPKTEPEKRGIIKRNDLKNISGRTRKAQLNLARVLGIENPPSAGGGCLLTDKSFALRAKDLFKHIKNPNINDVDLLKVGRHFRFNKKTKLVVGRNENENEIITSLRLHDDALFDTQHYVGPISVLRGEILAHHIELAAQITLRYSDTPINKTTIVIIDSNNTRNEVATKYVNKNSYIKYMI